MSAPDLDLQKMSQSDLTERKVQRRIVDLLRATGWHVTVTSTNRRVQRAIKGLPDIYATHRGYKRSLWVECKAPVGDVRDEQRTWMWETAEAGVPCLIASDPAHVEEWLRKEGMLK